MLATALQEPVPDYNKRTSFDLKRVIEDQVIIHICFALSLIESIVVSGILKKKIVITFYYAV